MPNVEGQMTSESLVPKLCLGTQVIEAPLREWRKQSFQNVGSQAELGNQAH